MTPTHRFPGFERFAALRRALGWSQLQMARELGLKGSQKNMRNWIHEMEIGKREISGPIGNLLERIAAERGIEGRKDHDANKSTPA